MGLTGEFWWNRTFLILGNKENFFFGQKNILKTLRFKKKSDALDIFLGLFYNVFLWIFFFGFFTTEHQKWLQNKQK